MNLLPAATERGLFSGSLLISVGLHLALATLVVWGGGLSKHGPPPVLTVSLVTPEPGLPGHGACPAPAGAPGVQAKSPGAPTATAVPPAPPSPKLKKKPKKRRAQPLSQPRPERVLSEIPPRPTPPVVQTPTPPRAAALRPAAPCVPAAPSAGSSRPGSGVTAGAARVGTGYGSGSASSAVLGYGQGGKGGGGNPATAQRHYLKLIRARILAQRQYPYRARQRHQEGVVRLRFTLCSAGTLSQGVEVVKASGFGLLDEQARQCVLAAAPFPPFPLDLKRDRLTVDLPIIYKISEVSR